MALRTSGITHQGGFVIEGERHRRRCSAAAWLSPLLAAGIFVLTLVLCGVAPLAAQRVQTSLLTETEGLPSSRILSVRQDATGRLWVLSQAGLTVYDGQSFETLRPSAGFPLRDVTGIALGPDREAWALGDGPQPTVVHWDGRQWRNLPTSPDLGPSSWPMLEVLPGSDAVRLVIATPQGAYTRWDGSTWNDLDGAPAEPATGLLARPREIMIATARGLYRLDETGTMEPASARIDIAEANIRAIAEARSGGVWLLTPTWLGRLDGDTLHKVLEADQLPLFDASARVSMVEDSSGGLFLGTLFRAYYLELANRTLRPFGVAEGLATEGILSLMRDREGSVWIASSRGLNRVASQRFLSYGRTQGLLQHEVTAILELGPNHIVLGHNTGLTHLEEGLTRQVPLAAGKPQENPIVRILDLASDDGKRIWTAALGLGLMRIDPDGTVRSFSREIGIEDAVSVEVDPQGRLWVAAPRKLLIHHNGRFEPFPLPRDMPGSIRWLTFLDQSVFLSTDRGLLRREIDAGDWQRIGHSDPAAENTYRLVKDRQGRIWIGTGGGLFRLHQDQLIRATGPLRIDRPIYLALEDLSGNLWFGTDNGVFVWDGFTMRHLSVQHGLAGREINRGAGLVDHRGRLWIGTELGASMYQARHDSRQVAAPVVELARVDTAAGRFDLDREINFDFTDRNLTFFFRAITLAPELGVEFRCRLLGFDLAWLEPCSAQAGMRYTNLPPGNHRFQVQARHTKGPWGRISTSAPIVIEPPLWRSGLFQAALGLALVLSSLTIWRAFERKRHAADHDPLTNFPNRSWFFRRLSRAIDRQRRDDAPSYAVLFLDLDGFKHVNDSLGHLVGDQFLIAIAERLRRQLAPNEHVARIGGDEFAILVEPPRKMPPLEPMVGRIRELFRQPFEVAGRVLYSEASIGVVLGAPAYVRPDQVLRDADSAMYRAKARGRGCYEVFDPGMLSLAAERLDLETDLRRAVESGQLSLEYQPIVKLDGTVMCLEALLRWDHPRRGRLLPDAFIAVAEETGLIVPIGTWVIQEVCRQIAHWRRELGGREGLQVHINVAAAQLLHGSLLDSLTVALARNEIPPSTIAVELTESTIVDDFDTAAEVLRNLRELGVRVFLDDFGQGQTSLRYLRRLPLDGLKLDRAFVAGLGVDPKELAIARMVADLGQQLGLQVIAEGVETAEQVELLAGLPCHAAQGFYYHRPMDPERAAKLIDSEIAARLT